MSDVSSWKRVRLPATKPPDNEPGIHRLKTHDLPLTQVTNKAERRRKHLAGNAEPYRAKRFRTAEMG